ncbi:small GTP-binding protein, putative [Trichomonas vaginalis G3]|uniref:Small GTP-binding protein, putative n=2 Tax=Trichomonas vaginalis TaxID=5722 RepID=A0A8U0WP30_TRIV3|nr:small Rab GTPase RabD7 [Trichomonas vaginalis G3]AAY83827.1 small Rab GTPase RabD7 [Trichomonas vaginalis]EAX96468.1 small GTP-binding protein, putative [Trichomonas vaginalis G3]KAI5503331.1 small Rab GTPase RabD7 [Trichomonas vaginalis G3]|eukprot:XP_001309398.1 small GTP-binding protein [Trichomonas vaginalis G3]
MEDDENAIKIVLLGDSGVGKTSIVSMFVSGAMPEVAAPTVGAAFVTKQFELNNNTFNLFIWDTAGQELYRGLAPMYYRNASIAFIVFDISREVTFNSVAYWIEELRENSTEDVIIVIVGNKNDLERNIDMAKCEQFATEHKAIYCETSATTATGIDRIFQLAIGEYERTQMNTSTSEIKADTVNISEKKKKEKTGCC